MSLGAVLGKRTWLGVAVAAAALLMWVMAGALLVTKRMLPVGMVDGWLYGGCVMAALLAGCAAGKGRGGRLLLPLVTAVLLYAVLWVVALSSSQPLDFSGRGLWITAAMLGGGLLSCLLLGGKKKKKRGKRQMPAAARRRKRAAT